MRPSARLDGKDLCAAVVGYGYSPLCRSVHPVLKTEPDLDQAPDSPQITFARVLGNVPKKP